MCIETSLDELTRAEFILVVSQAYTKRELIAACYKCGVDPGRSGVMGGQAVEDMARALWNARKWGFKFELMD